MAQLLKQEKGQSYYQLDFKVYVTASRYSIKEIFEADPPKFVEGVAFDEDVSECIDKICISDAHTHAERLVFPAFYVRRNEERILTHRNSRIAGKWTMMIHGGSHESMRKHEVYIRQLRMLNRKYN